VKYGASRWNTRQPCKATAGRQVAGRVVAAALVVDGADDGELVHHLGLLHHQFTELHASHIRVDCGERSSILDGRVRLGIVRLELCGTAG